MKSGFDKNELYVEAERTDNKELVQGFLYPKQPKGRCGVNWIIATVNTGRPISYEINSDTLRHVKL